MLITYVLAGEGRGGVNQIMMTDPKCSFHVHQGTFLRQNSTFFIGLAIYIKRIFKVNKLTYYYYLISSGNWKKSCRFKDLVRQRHTFYRYSFRPKLFNVKLFISMIKC